MNALAGIDMSEATRLTRDGRLHEATALLRRGLTGDGGGMHEAAANEPGTTSEIGGIWRAPPSATAAGPASWSPRAPKPAPAETRALSTPGARFSTHQVTNAAGRRAYKLYVPSVYDGTPLPLVVMLHGCTQSPDDFAAGTRMNALAEELRLLIAYPEQTKGANASKCWNWFKPGDQRRDRGEPSLVADITRQVMRDVAVDPSRVFVAGLSAGGAAAAIMAHAYPELYSGVCVHSGLACGAAKDLPSAFAAMRAGGAPGGLRCAVATIVFHGSADKTVHPRNASQVALQCDAAVGARRIIEEGRTDAGMAYTRTVDRDDRGVARLEQWTLHGAGHAWSGGSSAGSYTDPRGPDASREMMRFFLDAAEPGRAEPKNEATASHA